MHFTTPPQRPFSTPSPARPRTLSPFRSPVAFSSYHPNPTHDSNAPRRHLAGRSNRAAVRFCDGVSRALAGDRTAEPFWVSSAAGAIHTNTMRPSGPRLGVVAQDIRLRPCLGHPVHASGVQRPLRASSVHACLSTRPVSGVRCGRLNVQVSGVRCPVCPVSVRARVRRVRPGGRRGRRWVGSRMAGMAGVGVVACGVHDRLVVCPGRNLTVEAGAGRAGPAEASAWVDLATAHHLPRPRPSPAWPTRMGRMRARIALRWGSRVRSEVATTLRGHRGGPGPSRLVAASLPGWTATCACGRAAAASWSERRLLDANDALTCEYGGGGEGI